MSAQKTTRKTSVAERLAARALGQEVREEVEVPPSSAQQHYDRMRARAAGKGKPAGMSTADWFAHRYQPDERDDDAPPDVA